MKQNPDFNQRFTHTQKRQLNIKIASAVLNTHAINAELAKYNLYQLQKSAAVGAHRQQRVKYAALIRQRELEKQALLNGWAQKRQLNIKIAAGPQDYAKRMAGPQGMLGLPQDYAKRMAGPQGASAPMHPEVRRHLTTPKNRPSAPAGRAGIPGLQFFEQIMGNPRLATSPSGAGRATAGLLRQLTTAKNMGAGDLREQALPQIQSPALAPAPAVPMAGPVGPNALAGLPRRPAMLPARRPAMAGPARRPAMAGPAMAGPAGPRSSPVGGVAQGVTAKGHKLPRGVGVQGLK